MGGGREPITGAVEIHASFGMSKPATSGADVDNFAKIALDALQKAGILHNDRTVVKLVASKHHANLREIGVKITLIQLESLLTGNLEEACVNSEKKPTTRSG
jgi:Holliday junction resolvase RusA-like endonuclease